MLKDITSEGWWLITLAFLCLTTLGFVFMLLGWTIINTMGLTGALGISAILSVFGILAMILFGQD